MLKQAQVAWLVGVFVGWVLALVASGAVAAGSGCYEWVASYAGEEFRGSSPSAVAGPAIASANALAAEACIPSSIGCDHFSLDECIVDAGTAECKVNNARTAGPAAPTVCTDVPGYCDPAYSFSIGASQESIECEDMCSDKVGQHAFVGGSVGAGGNYCLAGCQVSTPLPTLAVRCDPTGVCSSGPTIYGGSYTGMTCGEEDSTGKAGNCVSGSFGKVCATEPNGKNCGTFNGDRVCVEDVESGCVSFASGGVACVVEGEGATDEVPDNGTPGMPANPQMQVSKDGQTVNYYNNTTVNNSSAPVASEPTDGDSGSGNDPDGDDGPEIPSGELGTPGLGEVDTYEQSLSGFVSRVEGSPIASALTGMGGSIPEGTCPVVEVEVFGETAHLDQVCTIVNSPTVGPIISACALFAWVLLGLILFFKA